MPRWWRVMDGPRHARQQPRRGLAVLEIMRNLLSQTAALDQLHAEEVLAFVFTDFVNGHDIRVIQVGGGLGFGMKTPHVRRRSQFAGQNHLQGDSAVEAYLPGLVDDPHAAAGDFCQQFVIAEIVDRRAVSRSIDGGFWGSGHNFAPGKPGVGAKVAASA